MATAAAALALLQNAKFAYKVKLKMPVGKPKSEKKIGPKKRCHCHWQCHLPSAKCQSAKVCSNIHKIFPLTFPMFCLSICLSFSLFQFLWFAANTIADKRYWPLD